MTPYTLDELLESLSNPSSAPPAAPAAPEPETPSSESIPRILENTLEELAPYHLAPKAERVVSEFLTFHLQKGQLYRQLPEAEDVRCNLLIRTDESEHTSRIAQILASALSIPSSWQHITDEKTLLREYEAQRSSRRPSHAATTLIDPGKCFLVIRDCQDVPVFDPDLPSAAAQDASKKLCENYNGMWKAVADHLRRHPECILIVGAHNDVYRGSLRYNSRLFFRICTHHLFVRPWTEDELLDSCLEKLNRSSFQLCSGFEARLRHYFHTVYPKAELRGQAFVDDLLRRIFLLYFIKQRRHPVLTLDCIPRYNTQAVSAEDILGQLKGLIGLDAVKAEFQKIYKMQLAGINDAVKPRYHMLFTGNPGTGKTTVAQMAADLFFRMNILKTNRLVVTKPGDLISSWVGGTSKKAAEIIRRAYDGVLFIDEAYGLTTLDRGTEVVNLLIQEMEANAHRLVVILAGYREEMGQLLKVNPGLSSRIGREIHFADYTLEELVKIFHYQSRRDGFSLDPSAAGILEDCISARMTREYFGNAREIGNMLQQLKEVWSGEYYETAGQPGEETEPLEKVFYPRHFEKIMPPKNALSIRDLVGLDTLKTKLEAFRRQVLFQKHLREKGIGVADTSSMHMIFTGNPGTGKTTVAKLIADDLYSIGVLKTNRLVVAERKDLVSSIVGETTRKTADMIRRAVGGVLFIDEAYSLAGGIDGLGRQVIEVFLTAMEEHKSDTVFIFAGYSQQMQEFLAMNPGIQSRIGYTFHFPDYSTGELTEMYAQKMAKAGFAVSAEALDKVREIMEYFQSVENFGNGRFVSHVIQQTVSQRAARDFAESYRDITAADIPTIKTIIDTAPNSMLLYDPAQITESERRRTAVHELGHAMVLRALEPDCPPESISIRNRAGSLGRVRLSGRSGNMTEQQMLNRIAVCLGGKNAEKLFLGNHSTGCQGDYSTAKRMAREMIEQYAMDTFGSTDREILGEAERLSAQILEANRQTMQNLVQILLERRELTGAEFSDLLAGNN